jgi:hypothetical protein
MELDIYIKRSEEKFSKQCAKKSAIEYKLSLFSLKTFRIKKGNKYKEINKLQI